MLGGSAYLDVVWIARMKQLVIDLMQPVSPALKSFSRHYALQFWRESQEVLVKEIVPKFN